MIQFYNYEPIIPIYSSFYQKNKIKKDNPDILTEEMVELSYIE